MKPRPPQPEIFANGRSINVEALKGQSVEAINTPTIQLLNRLRLGLGLAQIGDAVARLPLAALFKKFHALETLEDIALATQGGRRA